MSYILRITAIVFAVCIIVAISFGVGYVIKALEAFATANLGVAPNIITLLCIFGPFVIMLAVLVDWLLRRWSREDSDE